MRERLENKYVKLAITIFVAGAALILFYLGMDKLDGVLEGLSVIWSILSPFIYGLVMAYLLCPVYNFTVRRIYHATEKKWRTKQNALRFARVMATVIALVTLIGAVGGLFALIIPEMLRSIVGIVQLLPERVTELIDWVETTFAAEKFPQLAGWVEAMVYELRDSFLDWTQAELLPSIGTYMTQISLGVWFTLKMILNILIGIIVCVYFLNSKELFKAQARKIILATTNKEQSDSVFEFANFTNKTFGGFINGKIIDSVIMGILCFIVLSIFGLPYPVLIGVIVGVTNFIPFFGPFIGAIPSIIIILLVSPIQAVYFAIIILVLQQFDGNILGPKILGETTGLASFWVMFAIIVGGGLFGFAGMVLGVPVFAVIYYYTRKFIEKRLARKQMPTDTKEYEEFNQYNIDRKDVL
ncbi:putative PurR-regulated permease PerM [Clostridiales Family XIII bacterium PM5-7]